MLPLRSIALGGALCVLAVGCFIEEHHYDRGGSTVTPTPTGSGAADAGAGDGTPVLVDVDSNKTLSAVAGEGVGIFVEYKTGGHWHVWWTCDTNQTKQNCAMDISASVTTGSIANPASENFATTDALASPTAQSVRATAVTTTAISGMTFDASVGAVVTLDASIGGLRDGSFIFFVQNGIVNGGFKGKLTDPLMLEAASP